MKVLSVDRQLEIRLPDAVEPGLVEVIVVVQPLSPLTEVPEEPDEPLDLFGFLQKRVSLNFKKH
ncbi:MAG: hypothetical protein GDA38_24330 [Hormoscilla sp. SP12CHS1]|nr:hypothetical protein [Hormoscilla sp. SP12CHS1]